MAYKKGDVVKTRDGNWRVITGKQKVKKTTVYTGHRELKGAKVAKKSSKFRDKDIKWKIGDNKRDTAGLGKKRHAKEVKSLIKSARRYMRPKKRR